ncbi:MAG: type I-U CRISPR-associated protein Cas7 [Microthrixaceae bacterium]
MLGRFPPPAKDDHDPRLLGPACSGRFEQRGRACPHPASTPRGPDDKVFPPTYEGGRYATETRRINGEACEAVVLDSVASQANRQELALLVEKNAGAPIPTVAVDFGETDVPDLDAVTALEGVTSRVRRRLQGLAEWRHAVSLEPGGPCHHRGHPQERRTAVGVLANHLVVRRLGQHRAQGRARCQVQRAMTSEIVAIGVEAGTKTSSRIDVLGIEKSAGPVFVAADPDQTWEIDESLAATDKKGPCAWGRGSDLGRPLRSTTATSSRRSTGRRAA